MKTSEKSELEGAGRNGNSAGGNVLGLFGVEKQWVGKDLNTSPTSVLYCHIQKQLYFKREATVRCSLFQRTTCLNPIDFS